MRLLGNVPKRFVTSTTWAFAARLAASRYFTSRIVRPWFAGDSNLFVQVMRMKNSHFGINLSRQVSMGYRPSCLISTNSCLPILGPSCESLYIRLWSADFAPRRRPCLFHVSLLIFIISNYHFQNAAVAPGKPPKTKYVHWSPPLRLFIFLL